MKKYLRILFIGLSFLANIEFVAADNLQGALAYTYSHNLSISAARHHLKEVMHNVDLVKAGFYPVIQATAGINYAKPQKTQRYVRTDALQLQISQNLFSGYETVNDLNAAEAQVKAQKEILRNEEQNQLNNAVAAYVNVFASREIVRLRHSNLIALEEQVRAAKARLDVGEGTKTDYAQAQAAHSRAISEYSEAIATNAEAEAIYKQVVGVNPAVLLRPEICKNLPSSLKEALARAVVNHPAIKSAQYAVEAAHFAIDSKRASFLPSLNANAGLGYEENYIDGKQIGPQEKAVSFGIRLNVPIYQGGSRFAVLNKVKEQYSQAVLQADMYRNSVIASLTAAWAKLTSSKSSVMAYLESVKAAKIALDGRLAENKVGQATFLDVLNTRSQLINMQVALVNAKRSLVVASYNVKAAVGDMTADRLGLSFTPSSAKPVIVPAVQKK